MNYDMPLYRPPSEGNNIILQASLGCSFNKCSFCSMYRTKKFEIKDLKTIQEEIEHLAAYYPDGHRVFIADGDAMAMATEHLKKILKLLKEYFPKLSRVSAYASPLNLKEKTLEELKDLREAGLTLVYYGIESGNDGILKKITKGIDSKGMIEGLNKTSEAGIKISATVILGLGGQNYWKEHIDSTADLVNQIRVNYLSTLQLGLAEEVEGEFRKKFKEEFIWQDDEGMLKEQIRFIEKINPSKPVIFRSNHASNALSLAGNLPKDKEKLLDELQGVLSGENSMKPKWLRGF